MITKTSQPIYQIVWLEKKIVFAEYLVDSWKMKKPIRNIGMARKCFNWKLMVSFENNWETPTIEKMTVNHVWYLEIREI